jgi:hypothetical protein
LLIACGAILHNILLDLNNPADNDFDGFEEVGENDVPAQTGRFLSSQENHLQDSAAGRAFRDRIAGFIVMEALIKQRTTLCTVTKGLS